MTNKNNEYSIVCSCCGKTFDKDGVNPERIRSDGTVKRCKSCDWIYRHKGLPSIDGFNERQIRCALEFVLIGKSIYLNDLADALCLSLDDVIKLIWGMNIKGKKYKVKFNCAYCNKEDETNAKAYFISNYSYCSVECYRKHKKDIVGKGENNPFYNRIKTKCSNCNKDIEVTPYKYNEVNKFGDNHNFCSQECYWDYRSKYYTGEKSTRLHTCLSDEHKDKMRSAFIEWSKSDDRFNSKIQLLINGVLDDNHIQYDREYKVGYYSIDNYIVGSGLMIEVMGDYWHGSPLIYNDYNLLNNIQKKDISKDKSKRTYIKNKYGNEILYLWESDIQDNIDMCEILILKYIDNNGVLDNYHSFNWHVKNKKLKLNNNIVIPYQDIDIEYCKNNKAG